MRIYRKQMLGLLKMHFGMLRFVACEVIKFILSMKQEGKFTSGCEPEHVKISKEEVAKAKGYLKFEPKSEYYLRVPAKKMLPLLLFCLTGKTGTLTKKVKAISQKLKNNFWPTIDKEYLVHNDNRTSFIAPYQLEILASKTNYHFDMFHQCSIQFEMGVVLHTLNQLKKQDKVTVNYLGQNKPLGDKVLEDAAEAIYLVQEKDEIVLCAFSTKIKSFRKDERKSLSSLEEEEEQQQELPRKLTEKAQQELPRKLAEKGEEKLPKKLSEKAEQELPKKLTEKAEEELPRKLSEKAEPNKRPLRKVNEQEKEQPFVMQEQFNMEECLREAEQKKIHIPFTIVLVVILAVLIYCAFGQMPAGFYEGVNHHDKPILEHLVEGLDGASNALFG